MKRWTEKEKKWLIDHYNKIGPSKCMDELGLTYNQLVYIRNTLKLRLTKQQNSIFRLKTKKDEEYNVNPSIFYEISKPETSYFLGLLWADGSLFVKECPKRRVNKISISLKEQDINDLMPVFNNIGNWTYSGFKSNKTTNMYKTVSTNNRPLMQFLILNDFLEKSYKSPDAIIAKIPFNLQCHFFRGIVDGDGCFYFNNKHKIRKFTVTSSLKQDWTYLTNKLHALNVTYDSIKRETNNGSYSRIESRGKNNLQKINNFLYPVGFEFGLKRKYDKLQECLGSGLKSAKS